MGQHVPLSETPPAELTPALDAGNLTQACFPKSAVAVSETPLSNRGTATLQTFNRVSECGVTDLES